MLGVVAIVKSGTSATVSVASVLCNRLPLVPVMVRIGLPTGVLLLVLTVRVELPDPITVVGLNVPVAPAGSPFTPRFTTPLNPPPVVTVTVELDDAPGLTGLGVNADAASDNVGNGPAILNTV